MTVAATAAVEGEVYRPVWTPGGTPLLFETYFRYDTVSQRSQQLWRGFAGVMLSSILALLLLLGAGGWLLAVRARRASARQAELTRRALDASDAERRMIAATLHDGVVQQLVAASFVAAGQAQRAASVTGDAKLAADLDAVASAVRDGIAGLRSLLVDIYPPSLHTAGLASALRDLADTASRAPGHRRRHRRRCRRQRAGTGAGSDVPHRPGSGTQRGASRPRRAPRAAPGDGAGHPRPGGRRRR